MAVILKKISGWDTPALFPELKSFRFQAELIKPYKTPWDAIASLGRNIPRLLTSIAKNHECLDYLPGYLVAESIPPPRKSSANHENWIRVDRSTRIEHDMFFPDWGVFIGAGTRLEATALIHGPAIIGRDCDIRQGAYVRGSVVTGDKCVIGHATEIKNAVLMNHTEAGHFTYIGDSIIGSYVNFGAGTKLANLQFRSIEEKKKGFIRPIIMTYPAGAVRTGVSKFGAVIGDYCELGCNSVTSPGVILGADSRVYPNIFVRRGSYPPKTVVMQTETATAVDRHGKKST